MSFKNSWIKLKKKETKEIIWRNEQPQGSEGTTAHSTSIHCHTNQIHQDRIYLLLQWNWTCCFTLHNSKYISLKIWHWKRQFNFFSINYRIWKINFPLELPIVFILLQNHSFGKFVRNTLTFFPLFSVVSANMPLPSNVSVAFSQQELSLYVVSGIKASSQEWLEM